MTHESHLDTAVRIGKQFGFGRAITYWRAALSDPKAMLAWSEFLAMHVAPEERDALRVRVLRPYMRQHFTPEKRRQLLRDHITAFAPYVAQQNALKTEPGLVAATLTVKNDETYALYIGGNTSKEGELSIGLYDTNGHYLAKMAVTIGQDEQGQPVLWLGGLQGAKPPMGRDEVVKTTRDCYGLRPKGAVLMAAQILAQHFGLTALRAPGNEGHISQRGLNRIRAKRKIHADYGEFWLELGGEKISEEEYSIPVTPLVRDISEVKQNKRSEWKKRQALSEQLQNDVRTALSSWRVLH